jgi:hypothetical protein
MAVPAPKQALHQVEVTHSPCTAIARTPEEGDPAWGQLDRHYTAQFRLGGEIRDGGELCCTFLHEPADREVLPAARISTAHGHFGRTTVTFQGATAFLGTDEFCRVDAWGFLYRAAHFGAT